MGSMVQEPKKNLLREACRAFERYFILNALEKTRWSPKEAARILGLPLSTLKYRRKALGLSDSRPDRQTAQSQKATKAKKSANYQAFLGNGDSLREACSKFEIYFILKALKKAQWDRRKASQALGLPLSTLKYKLSKRSWGG